jgi:hypothetical protein
MGIKNILELEKENQQIILHKEGLFIKVYERSAYLFTKNIKEYKLTKKFYKNVKQEVVYMGFPQNSFSKIERICKEQGFQLNKEKEKQIGIIGIESFVENEFLSWKLKISLLQNEPTSKNPNAYAIKENVILKKIHNFSVISKTPIECQQFIVALQQELNG